jgi:hypothetical protein
MSLPILLTEDDLIAWCTVDPSVRADNLDTLAGICVLLLLNQASLDLDLPLDLVLRLNVGYNDPASDVTVLQYVVVQAFQMPDGIKLG